MKTRPLRKLVQLACCIPATVAGTCSAEPALDWYTLPGGGGVSTNQTVQLFGTVAQIPVGSVAGENVTLRGGFLSFGAAVSPLPEVITWTNRAGGNWTTRANWSPNRIPGPGQAAMINLPGTYTVTLDSDVSAGLLVLGGAPGVQSLDWKYGGFSGNMEIETNAVLNLTGGSLTLNGTVRNRGRIYWPANQQVTWRLESGAELIIESTGFLDLQGHGSFSGSLARGVRNLGVMRKSSDPGKIQAYPGLLFTHGGLLDIQAGTLALNGLESSSQVNLAANAVLEVDGGNFNLHPGHIFTGEGKCWFNGLAAVNGSLNGPVVFTVSGIGPLDAELHSTMWWTNGILRGNLTIAPDGTFNLLNFSGVLALFGAIRNEGRIAWQGNASGLYCYETARIENMPGALVDLLFDANLTLPAGTWLNNQGTLRKSAGMGRSTFYGTQVYTNSGTIDVQSGTLDFNQGLTSSGRINVTTGAELMLEGGACYFGPNHTFSGLGACTFGGSSLRLYGPLAGTVSLIMEYHAVLDCTLNAAMTWKSGNLSGALTVAQNGTLVLTTPGTLLGTITNYGTVNWAGPGSWSWDPTARFENKTGALLDLRADLSSYARLSGTLYNEGTIRKSAGTGLSILDIPFSNSGYLSVESGKLRLTAPYQESPAAALTFDLGAFPSGTLDARVEFVKPPALAGRLRVTAPAGFRPKAGTVFTLLKYPSVSGNFTGFQGLDLGDGLNLVPRLGPTDYIITAALDPNPPVSLTVLPGSLRIRWPSDYTGWRLYSTTNLLNPIWQVVPTPTSTVEIPTTKPQEIFRLGPP